MSNLTENSKSNIGVTIDEETGEILPQFNSQVVDSKEEYGLEPRLMTLDTIENIELIRGWYYKDISLRLLYSHAPFLTLNFKKNILPKRCTYGYDILYNMLYKYMSLNRTRVNKRSIAKVSNCLVKNISRTVFYETKGLRYNRNEAWWGGNKNSVSNKIFLELISLLEDENSLISYSGLYGGEKYENISSLLVLTPEIIQICTGGNSPRLMDECLKHYISHYVIIRTKISKHKKIERPLVKGEIMQARKLEKEMKSYNEAIARHELKVNGKLLQDLYFRSIFTEDLEHGGRLADHGEFQSLSKRERKTLIIDNCETVSLDYKALHPSILYAKEGINLKGHDPYACKIKMDVDLEEVFEFAYDNAMLDLYNHTYDPNRNLCKVALLCMINASSEKDAVSAISKSLRDDYRRQDQGSRKYLGLQKPVKIKEVVEELTKTNAQISKYFFTGYGTVLQKMDSDMIRYAISSFLIEDKILLPVHDSISIKEEDEELGMEVLYEAYGSVVGTSLNCRVEVE